MVYGILNDQHGEFFISRYVDAYAVLCCIFDDDDDDVNYVLHIWSLLFQMHAGDVSDHHA